MWSALIGLFVDARSERSCTGTMRITLARVSLLAGLFLLCLGGTAHAGAVAPEIDPGSAGGAIALAVTAGLLVLEHTRRKRVG